jgi:nitroreductase
LLEKLIWAATRAPNPRNLQPWEFVVVTEDTQRAAIGALLEPRAAEVEAAIARLEHDWQRRMYQRTADLIRSLGTAPAIVFVCGRRMYFGREFPAEEIVLSAVHTAAQNILLAARALGLGTVFTTLHLHAAEGIRGLLALPDDVRIAVTIPVGWPVREFGPLRRKPLGEVLHWDRFEPGRPAGQD